MGFMDCARGVQLDDRHASVDAAQMRGNIDYVVVYAGSQSERSLRFTQHLVEAQSAGVPVLAFFDAEPDCYRGINFEGDRMPDAALDANMKVLIRQLKSGAEMRYVHGIIINLRYYHTDGSNPTAGWMRKIYEHLSACAWQLFKLPVYYYVDKKAIDAFPGENPFTTWLDNIKYFCSWESAYLDEPAQVRADWRLFPVPDDAMDNLHLQRGIGWQFWKYANTKFLFDGITDAGGAAVPVPAWLYAGSQAKLHSELPAFEPPALPEPEPEPQPEPEPDDDEQPDEDDEQQPQPEPDGSYKSILIGALVAALDAFSTAWLQGRHE